MRTLVELDHAARATDGEIAAINLESARRRAWARFAQDPRRPGVAEAIVDNEHLAAQFLGDLDALDRLEELASQFARVDDSFRAALVHAEVASTVHRFADARDHLARAALMGGPREEIERHSLSIDQACGVNLDAVLAARRQIARRAAGSKIWCLSAPCLPISSASPRRTLSIGRRFPRTTTFRRSRWRGFAFSSACCGESSCPCQTRILPRSGIDAQLLTCRAM